jgi:hypothetical protein
MNLKRRKMLFLAAGFMLVGVLIYHESTFRDWKQYKLNFDNAGFTQFLLPLDSRFRGMSGGVDLSAGVPFCWAFGPDTQLRFKTFKPMELQLRYGLASPFGGQTVDLFFNGKQIAHHGPLSRSSPEDSPGVQYEQHIRSRAGVNVIVFKYAKWNHGEVELGIDDPRLFAIAFTSLQLLPKLHAVGG